MQTWLSSTSTWLKKQYFNGSHYLQLLSNQADSKLTQQDIHLFGIRFGKQNRQQALKLYQTVLWFTYRDGLCFEGYANTSSDVGWGCMLRVGQMMLAQVLRIWKGAEYYCNQGWINGLIWEFINQNGKFSIENIVRMGQKTIQKAPGEWYSSYDIAIVLKRLMQSKYIPATKNPYLNEQLSLQIIISTSQFSLKSVYQQTKIVDKEKPNLFKTKSCLLIVICRIGWQKPQQSSLQNLISILKQQKTCVGVLGGRPGKAHYIFGTSEKSFIYLDPHCVKNQTNIESFLCETLFSMTHDKIDPSMGICFYLDNFKEMMLLHERLRKMKGNQLIYCHQFEKFQSDFGLEIQVEEKQVYQILQ